MAANQRGPEPLTLPYWPPADGLGFRLFYGAVNILEYPVEGHVRRNRDCQRQPTRPFNSSQHGTYQDNHNDRGNGPNSSPHWCRSPNHCRAARPDSKRTVAVVRR
jgi:hypothetical protein